MVSLHLLGCTRLDAGKSLVTPLLFVLAVDHNLNSTPFPRLCRLERLECLFQLVVVRDERFHIDLAAGHHV